MCGIAGCVLADGRSPDRAKLAAMGAALAHRGPDASGVEVFENVGLVHRRLAIVDPTPAGAQPMTHAASDYASAQSLAATDARGQAAAGGCVTMMRSSPD